MGCLVGGILLRGILTRFNNICISCVLCSLNAPHVHMQKSMVAVLGKSLCTLRSNCELIHLCLCFYLPFVDLFHVCLLLSGVWCFMCWCRSECTLVPLPEAGSRDTMFSLTCYSLCSLVPGKPGKSHTELFARSKSTR